MNDYRGIFALLSLAAGLILLIAAARYAFATKTPTVMRRKRVVTTAVYAVLFLAVGGVLWTRQGVQEAAEIKTPPPREEEKKVVAPDTTSPQVVKQTTPVVRDATEGEIVESLPVLPEAAPVEKAVRGASEEERIVVAEPPGRMQAKAREEKRAVKDAESAPPKNAEDRIAWVVNRAFTAIEKFFDQHATPVSSPPERVASRKTVKPARGEIRFPRVTFEEQTAEMSPESEAALKRLARDLMQRPGFNLEIQARVDSVGPEAFNYLLTQARATAVRDYLVVEGVPAERLIARGFGSEPIPQANGQLIAFVVRR